MGLTWGLLAVAVLCLLAAGIRVGEAMRTSNAQVDYLLQHSHELTSEVELRDRRLEAQAALLRMAEAWMTKAKADAAPPQP